VTVNWKCHTSHGCSVRLTKILLQCHLSQVKRTQFRNKHMCVLKSLPKKLGQVTVVNQLVLNQLLCVLTGFTYWLLAIQRTKFKVCNFQHGRLKFVVNSKSRKTAELRCMLSEHVT